jgi:hypothetical protein
MAFDGIVIGAATFFIIGVFHPIVIGCEYHFGVRAWPVFCVLGIVALSASVVVDGLVLRSILGVLGFTLLWSIRELFEQAERVRKGWFPRKPSKAAPEVAGRAEKDELKRYEP